MCDSHSEGKEVGCGGRRVKCPFGVSVRDVLLIDDLHLCLHELLMLVQVKVCRLESEKGEAQ